MPLSTAERSYQWPGCIFSGFLKCMAVPVIHSLVPSSQFRGAAFRGFVALYGAMALIQFAQIRPPSALPAFLLLHLDLAGGF
ncbi:hypothetical protein B0H17DRAFT_1052571 [Mycena rosella]|uniref:Uncharacterized protein n=1 Tax=Mycena rosella TaxID=1033263 RepID=A0AAD7GP42_MYCRO|nr:hypothetical protein B0H17DRAFT_1052571 [Mycena rosella]